jgi:hypothetical protein
MQDTFVKQASESDLILIDKKVDTAAPWPVWAEQIVQSGFAIVSISPGMQSDFEGLQVLAGGIRFKDKQSFSFVERTDGYFPIGYSFLKEKENSDLCEIFNYWHRFKEDHQPTFTHASRAMKRRCQCTAKRLSTKFAGSTSTPGRS